MDRREFLRRGAMTAALPMSLQSTVTAAAVPSDKGGHLPSTNAPLRWLDGVEPSINSGHVWGYPWAQGALTSVDVLDLISENGQSLPVQSWVTAWWPDGSIKWTAHALSAKVATGGGFRFEQTRTTPTSLKQQVSLQSDADSILVDTGVVQCRIPTSGQYLLTDMSRGGRVIARHARLIGQVQNAPVAPADIETFVSELGSVEVEQSGPVRAVVHLQGKQRREGGQDWLPFSLRLIFTAGSDAIKVSHSFIFDGDDQQDFICGMGLRFEVLQVDAPYDRHIRFSGEGDGLWAESPQGLTGLRRDPGQSVRQAQIDGKKTPPLSEWSPKVSERLHWVPVWNDYTLSQLSANGFQIRKRTAEGQSWIDAAQGHRSSGVAYVGGVSGGVLVGMRDFWQLHPTQIDVRNAGAEESEVTLWFWSPQAPAMDVRFYHDGLGQETYEDQLDALNITYEDYEEGFATAVGVARTSDITLVIKAATPSRQETAEWARVIQQPGQIVAAPEIYLQAGVFGGLWSLPDTKSEASRRIEKRLAWQVDFYRRQVDQHHWYGFWNYGDVMHTYDVDRHEWRYDVGGYAWDNSELSPDLWLWYSFLRSGDAATFRLAEAMTRHNRDVDIYHLGRFKGLGSRHNVQHWGCSAKQLRISTAIYKRFHYFLTADPRTGDILQEVTEADVALAAVDPTRKLSDRLPMPGPERIQVGTDWGSVAANWLAAWERTGDPQYRDWLVAAMQVIGRHPQGFFAGNFGYDPETKRFIAPPDQGPQVSHLSAVFGLVEVNAELLKLIDVPEYRDAWLKYCRLYNASKKEQKAVLGEAFGNNLAMPHSRLTAFAAAQDGDSELAKRAWQEFGLPQEFSLQWDGRKEAVLQVDGPDVLNPVTEAPWLSTNDASQWGLAAIQNLALISDSIDNS